MTQNSEKPKDPMLDFPGYLLRRASIAALAELNLRLAQLNLRHVESSLLLLIRANPGIRQGEVGNLLDIQRANMVPLVAKLESGKLITRKAIDGRSKGIWLTAAGRAMAKKANAIVQSCEQDLIERVPSELRPVVQPILLALWQGPVADWHAVAAGDS